MTETITANYTYTFERFFMLIRARRERDRTWLTTPYLVLPLIAAVVLLAITWQDGTLARMPRDAMTIATYAAIVAATFAATCMIVFLVDLLFDKLVYRIVFKRYASANKHIHFDIGDAGIQWTAEHLNGQLSWPAIKSVTVLADQTAAVAWLGKIEGLLLPADGFSSHAEYEEAIARIKEKYRVS